MTKNIDIINNAAVELIMKAAILAARFSGRVRKRRSTWPGMDIEPPEIDTSHEKPLPADERTRRDRPGLGL